MFKIKSHYKKCQLSHYANNGNIRVMINKSVSTRRFNIAAVFVLTAFLVLAGYLYKKNKPVTPIINEVCTDNFSVIDDENEKYHDYIELYNPSGEDMPLTGYWLSDSKKNLHKYALDAYTIPAGGCLLLWADKSGMPTAQQPFSLDSDGDTVYLTHGIEVTDRLEVPSLEYNTAYGRSDDGSYHVMTPTPGTVNTGATILPQTSLKEPKLSRESGFYDEAFDLTITAKAGQKIYYTTDGSEPDPETSQEYTGPIHIEDSSSRPNVISARTDLSPGSDYTPAETVDKAVIIRAAAYDPYGNRISRSVTGSYFIGYQNRSEYDDYPVVSLVVDPDDLFDYENGIYVNGITLDKYKEMTHEDERSEHVQEFSTSGGGHLLRYEQSNAFRHGKKQERKSSVSFFDRNHQLIETDDLGARIAGHSTRSSIQKSFNLYARSIYGTEKIGSGVNALIDTSGFTSQKSPFTLKNASKIRLRSAGHTAILYWQDEFVQSLCSDRSVDVEEACPCAVFLNGEYWGLYTLRTQYTDDYFRQRYGIDDDNAIWTVITNHAEQGGQSAQDAMEVMVTFISTYDMSDADLYDTVCGWTDIQSLIDYYCINLYLDNEDVSTATNSEMWRTEEDDGTPYGDTRWRYSLFDLDETLADVNADTFEIFRQKANNFYLPQYLYANEDFRRQFCNTFMDLANTDFEYHHVHEMMQEWAEYYRTQSIESHHRFSDPDYGDADYNADLEEADAFFRDRPSVILPMLERELNLQGERVPVTVQIRTEDGKEGEELPGSVLLNTAEISQPDWTGEYYTDFSVTATAKAADGWHFERWEGDVQGTKKTVSADPVMGGITLTAVFAKD